MQQLPAKHPSDGRCKRCGSELPRLWMPHPFAPGEMIADRWCSDHCYGVELPEQSQRACRASRMRTGGGDSDKSRKENDE